MVSDTRLYGAGIAVVSGLYSLWSASMASRTTTGSWLMAVIGVVVLVHGAILLTGDADRLGDASGPLMVGYAALMLLNQVLLGTGTMNDDGGMGTSASNATAAMGWDAGMVALAVLMLVSGLIMHRDERAESGSDGM